MALKSKGKIHKVGNSLMITIPNGVPTGSEATKAVDKIMIADPKGKIDEDDLLEFLEKIEPQFWDWYRKKRESNDE